MGQPEILNSNIKCFEQGHGKRAFAYNNRVDMRNVPDNPGTTGVDLRAWGRRPRRRIAPRPPTRKSTQTQPQV